MDTKNLIKIKINEADPTLDTSEGSGLTDILINPAVPVISYVESELQLMRDNLSIRNYDTMTEEDLNALAGNYLLTRDTGAKATGYVKIWFTAARNLTLPKNTIFKTEGGISFINEKEYGITESLMSLNIDSPYYTTGNIPVIAIVEGDSGEIDPEKVTRIEGATFDFVKVSNPIGFSGGADKETNAQFYTRITESLTSETASSPRSVNKILSKFFTIKSVKVIGFNDAEMDRDVAYEYTDYTNYWKEDYFGKQATVSTNPHNYNIGGVFIYPESTPPVITNVSISEYTTDQYEGLYRLSDALYCEAQSYNILNEVFSGTEIQNSWVLSDSRVGYASLQTPDEIKLTGGAIRLGISEATDPNLPVVLSKGDYAQLQNSVTLLSNIFTTGEAS